ncbi:MAG: hypothetical protein AB7U75_14455 [Hyphomicrobiaceae bacterium]
MDFLKPYESSANERIERKKVEAPDLDILLKAVTDQQRPRVLLWHVAGVLDIVADKLRDPELFYVDKINVMDMLRLRAEELRNVADLHHSKYTTKEMVRLALANIDALDRITRLVEQGRIRRLP